MHRSHESVLKSLQELYTILVDTAKSDDVISEEELAILNSVHQSIETLEIQIVQILTDDLDDEEFDDLLDQVIKDLVYNATQIAKSDNTITQDESELLKKLREFAEKGF